MSGTMDDGTIARGIAEESGEVEVTPKRLAELIRWHGTDERALPPPHTLQHLSRDTVAALRELARARRTVAHLRAAMGRAFWAANRSELNSILLEALGPPPQDERARGGRSLQRRGAGSQERSTARLGGREGRGGHHPGSVRSISPRTS